MVEGIYYYPRQKKQKKWLKTWVLLLVIIVAIAFWYFNKTNDTADDQPILIKVENSNLKPIAVNVAALPKTQNKPDKITENLDEAVFIHQQTNQKNQ